MTKLGLTQMYSRDLHTVVLSRVIYANLGQRSCVKVYLQDSLVTNNFPTVNPNVTKLESQVHFGSWFCHGSHAKIKGHLRSYIKVYLQDTL